MYGWNRKILKIDLDKQSFEIIYPSEEIYNLYIGGKGLAGYYLKPYIKYSWHSPEMPLLFFTGPLVNTSSPTSGRMVIMSRSPLTGTVGDTSVGGKLGFQIKKAGWDGIIITGKSKSCCGIIINDLKVEFVNASELKDKTISASLNKLSAKGSVALTGPAAENGVSFSGISIDGHYYSGRNGLGLVMAEKNLKYLNISGSGSTKIYDKSILKQARKDILRLVSASSVLKGEMGISNYGTGALYDLMISRRMMPSNNFKETYFDGASKMNAWNYKQKYETKKMGCAGCTILCKQITKDNRSIPEFETMSHFSALLKNDDIETVVEANRLCNEFGMDTITTAATLSCYSEIEGRILTPYVILQLIKDIAYSRGVGEELKYGSQKYSISKNNPGVSMSVKGLELPAYDPRGAYGMALAYATSTRGACHLRAYPIAHEILRKPVATDRFSFSSKARIIKLSEDQNAVIDSLTACKFTFFAATLEEYAKAFYGVTGVRTTAYDLMKTGERIYYNERIMNSMNGFSADDDILPDRFFTESGSGGEGINIKPINKEEFLKTLEDYYKIRGLDENGMPVESKVKELLI